MSQGIRSWDQDAYVFLFLTGPTYRSENFQVSGLTTSGGRSTVSCGPQSPNLSNGFLKTEGRGPSRTGPKKLSALCAGQGNCLSHRSSLYFPTSRPARGSVGPTGSAPINAGLPHALATPLRARRLGPAHSGTADSLGLLRVLRAPFLG